MQLDIFKHNNSVALRNDVVRALELRDPSASRAACESLAAEYPTDSSLPELHVLTAYLDATEADGGQAFRDHESLNAARQKLDALSLAAKRSLGEAGACAWIAEAWRQLAQRARLLAFEASCPQDHAAACWLHAGDWKQVADAVESIESWRRKPVPLAWMAEARLHLLGLRATWPLLAELGWLAPKLLEDIVPRSPDPLLPRLMSSFEAGFEASAETGAQGSDDDASWFAAWVLIEKPELREPLAAAQPSRASNPARAMRLIVELLGLEQQGGRHADMVDRRKELAAIQPWIFEAYKKRR